MKTVGAVAAAILVVLLVAGLIHRATAKPHSILESCDPSVGQVGQPITYDTERRWAIYVYGAATVEHCWPGTSLSP